MSRYGYLEVFQSPLEFEITRVNCSSSAAATLVVVVVEFFVFVVEVEHDSFAGSIFAVSGNILSRRLVIIYFL